MLERLAGRSARAVPFVRGASTFALTGLGMGFGFLLQVALARLMGAEDYGVFAYAWAWLNLLGWAAVMGHDVLAMREISALRARSDWPLLLGVRNHARLAVALAAGAIAAALALAAQLLADPPLAGTMLLAAVALPAVALLRLHAAMIMGGGAAVRGIVPERVARDAVTLLLLAGWWSLGLGIEPWSAMALVATAALACLGLAAAMEGALSGSVPRAAPPAHRRRAWLGSALALAFMTGTQLALQRLDVVLLGAIDRVESVGIYMIAVAVAELAFFAQNAFAALFAPAFSAHAARGDSAGMSMAARTASRIAFAGAAAISAVLLAFAPGILSLFGPGFEAGAGALRVLVVLHLVRAAMGPGYHVLTMSGNESVAARIVAVAAVANLILNLLLIPAAGMVGAALASGAAAAAAHGAMAFAARRLTGVAPWPFGGRQQSSV